MELGLGVEERHGVGAVGQHVAARGVGQAQVDQRSGQGDERRELAGDVAQLQVERSGGVDVAEAGAGQLVVQQPLLVQVGGGEGRVVGGEGEVVGEDGAGLERRRRPGGDDGHVEVGAEGDGGRRAGGHLGRAGGHGADAARLLDPRPDVGRHRRRLAQGDPEAAQAGLDAPHDRPGQDQGQHQSRARRRRRPAPCLPVMSLAVRPPLAQPGECVAGGEPTSCRSALSCWGRPPGPPRARAPGA